MHDTSTTPATPRQLRLAARLRGLSTGVQALAALGGTFMTVLPMLLAFAPLGWVAMLLGGADEGNVMHLLEADLTSAVRARLVAVMLIPVAASLGVLWQVWRLFGQYRQGLVFSAAALSHLRRLAWALVALAVVQPLARALMSVAISLDNAPGHRHLMLSFGSDDFALLLLALVFVAIARVMVEAAQAADEVEQFI